MTFESERHLVEQTFMAVRALAIGGGGLLARLEEASDALLSLETKEVPLALQEEFAGLLATFLTTEDIGSLGETEAADIALRILLFHEKVLLNGQRA